MEQQQLTRRAETTGGTEHDKLGSTIHGPRKNRNTEYIVKQMPNL